MRQKLISMLIAVCMLLSAAANTAFAEKEKERAQIVYNGDSMDSYLFRSNSEDSVDNLFVCFSEDYAYIDDNWNTLIDLQWFMDAVGGEMTRDNEKITLKKGEDVIEMDNNGIIQKITVNGKTDMFSYADNTNPPRIVNDKTTYNQQLAVLSSIPPAKDRDALYYPVRPLAESFGWKIKYTPGTDKERPIINLFDAGGYVESMKETAPNLYKMLNTQTPLVNLSDCTYSIKLDITPANSDAVKAAINMAVNSKLKDGAAAISGTFDIDIQPIIDFLTHSEYTVPKLDGVTVDLMINENAIYAKTNLFEKLYEADKTNPYFDLLESLLDKEKWLRLDINELMEYIGVDYMTSVIPGDFSEYASGELTGAEYMESVFDNIYDIYEDIGYLPSADMMNAIMQAYRIMDKYIVINDTDNGGYTVKIDLTTDDIINIIQTAVSDMVYTDSETTDAAQTLSEEEIKQIKDTINIDIHMNSSYSPNGANTDLNMALGLDFGDDIGKGTLVINGTQTAKVTNDFDMPNIPERAIDLNTVIEMIDNL